MLKHRVFIDRPPEAVWRFLADPDHLPAWNRKIVEIEKLSFGDMDRGYRYQVTYRMSDRVESAAAEVTHFEPPARLEIRVTGDRMAPRGFARESYRLRPKGGGTELIQEIDLHESGMPGYMRWLVTLSQGANRRRGSRYLTNLKRLVESATTG
jgi:carbon monoxide dehydrogenase subunit G